MIKQLVLKAKMTTMLVFLMVLINNLSAQSGATLASVTSDFLKTLDGDQLKK